MTQIGRLIAVILAIVLVVGAFTFLFFRSPMASEGVYRVMTAAGLEAAEPERHVVPEDFEGWAVVRYGVEGAPPLQLEDGTRVIEYPASGSLDTSSPAPEDEGFLHRGYYRKTPDGLVPLSRAGDIWGEFTHLRFLEDTRPGAGRSSGFYVGTMAGFRATEWPVEHRVPVAAQEQ